MYLCQQKCGDRNLQQSYRNIEGKKAKDIFDPICFWFQQNHSYVLNVIFITKAVQIQTTFLTTSKVTEGLYHLFFSGKIEKHDCWGWAILRNPQDSDSCVEVIRKQKILFTLYFCSPHQLTSQIYKY